MRNDPFERIPDAPELQVTSTDVVDGEPLPSAQMSGAMGVKGGGDVSPQLSWSGAPEGTKSYAVTMYDPDAPTQAGFWHWAVVDIPASVTELPTGVGERHAKHLPAGAFQLRNDSGKPGFVGAAPPVGHGKHRYFITVHALDVESLEIPEDSTPAYLGFNMFSHTLARGGIVATAER